MVMIEYSAVKSRVWITGSWLAVVLTAATLIGLRSLHENSQISPFDTSAYLEQAREIQRIGGPFGWLIRSYQGRYAQANQMPLYVLILSQLRFGSIRVLGWAKLLTLLIGLGGIVLTFSVAQRLFGLPVAILSSSGVATRGCYMGYTTIVACESLLAIWILLAWASMAQHLRSGKRAAMMGLFVALAYMTKGTGLLLLPVALSVIFVRTVVKTARSRSARRDCPAETQDRRKVTGRRDRRMVVEALRRFALSRNLYAFLGVFVLTASPVIVRNLRRYGTPFYNVNEAVVWMDTWDQYFSRDPEIRHPTMRSYLATHSTWQIADRLASGLVLQFTYLLVAVGWIVLILMLAAFSRRKWRPIVWPGFAIGAIFFVFFSWYPVKDVRFVVPLIPIVVILAAAGFDSIMRFIAGERRWLPRAAALALALLLITRPALAVLSTSRIFRDPIQTYQPPPAYFEVLDWLRENVGANTTWMHGPTHSYAYPWVQRLSGRPLPIPWVQGMDDLQADLRDRDVRFLLLDASTLRQRQRAFQGYLELAGEHGLRVQQLPAGWRLVAANKENPPTIMIFEILQNREPRRRLPGEQNPSRS